MRIGNYTFEKLKEKYGTPLYLYDETIIINNLNTYKTNFKSDLFQTEIVYAGKAFLTKYMTQLIKRHNLALDCVSIGEVYTAVKAGFDPEKIVFHGNNKTEAELIFALNNRVGTIIIDNLFEAELLLNLQSETYRPKAMLRVNLAYDVNTHKYIKTSIEDSKFGVSVNEKSIQMIKRLSESKKVNFIGLHSHIGSQILEEDYFYNHAKIMLKIYHDLKINQQIDLPQLNLGGGFGIKYIESDQELDLPVVLKKLIKTVEEESLKYNLNLEKVLVEPGRSIVGNAGYTLYTIDQIKKTKHLNYLFIDGSMNDNIRTALYQAKYEAIIVGKENETPTTNYKVAGKACETGDIIIEDIKLPTAFPNDLLLVKNTGAYHYSMASNYNRFPIPAVVFVNDNELKLVVRRQTLADLIRYDQSS